MGTRVSPQTHCKQDLLYLPEEDEGALGSLHELAASRTQCIYLRKTKGHSGLSTNSLWAGPSVFTRGRQRDSRVSTRTLCKQDLLYLPEEDEGTLGSLHKLIVSRTYCIYLRKTKGLSGLSTNLLWAGPSTFTWGRRRGHSGLSTNSLWAGPSVFTWGRQRGSRVSTRTLCKQDPVHLPEEDEGALRSLHKLIVSRTYCYLREEDKGALGSLHELAVSRTQCIYVRKTKGLSGLSTNSLWAGPSTFTWGRRRGSGVSPQTHCK